MTTVIYWVELVERPPVTRPGSLNLTPRSLPNSMRYPPGHKAETRQRILSAAETAFKRKGFQGCGVDAVMAEAGLTAGAFYRHFESKEHLFAEVLSKALAANQEHREEGLDDLEGADWVEGLVRRYLSSEHHGQVEHGCPIPALASEVSRATPRTQQALHDGLEEWRDQIARRLPLPAEEASRLAHQLVATMVGAMTLARSLPPHSAQTFLTNTADEAVRSLRHRCSRTPE